MAFDEAQPVHVRVKAWRLENSYTMAEAAKLCGLKSGSAWAYYEDPKRAGPNLPHGLRVIMGEIVPEPVASKANAALKAIVDFKVDPVLGLTGAAVLSIVQALAAAGLAED